MFNIRWNDTEKQALKTATVEVLLDRGLLSPTGKIPKKHILSAINAAQKKILPKVRYKDMEELKTYLSSAVLKGYELAIREAWELQAVPVELIEDALRPEDLALINNIESRFREELKARLEAAKEEILSDFKEEISREILKAKEQMLERELAAIEKAVKEIHNTPTKMYPTPVLEKEKKGPRILVIGISPEQKNILAHNYPSVEVIMRGSTPPNPTEVLKKALNYDRVFVMPRQIERSVYSGLSRSDYTAINGLQGLNEELVKLLGPKSGKSSTKLTAVK